MTQHRTWREGQLKIENWRRDVVQIVEMLGMYEFPACLLIRELTDWLQLRYGRDVFRTRTVSGVVLGGHEDVTRWHTQITYDSRAQSVYVNQAMRELLGGHGDGRRGHIVAIRKHRMLPEKIYEDVRRREPYTHSIRFLQRQIW